QQMGAPLEDCVLDIRRIQEEARTNGECRRARWPMIVLRTPKGWTGPKEVDGHQVEGSWRAHQVPLAGMHANPAHMTQLETWLRSYRPEELFDDNGRLTQALKALAPKGTRRMSATPRANGGLCGSRFAFRTFRPTPSASTRSGRPRPRTHHPWPLPARYHAREQDELP